MRPLGNNSFFFFLTLFNTLSSFLSAFIGPTLGGFLYEKIGFEWAAAVQGLWALTSVSSLLFSSSWHLQRSVIWSIGINCPFHCVKGIGDGLVLPVGARTEKKVWSVLGLIFFPLKISPRSTWVAQLGTHQILISAQVMTSQLGS